MKRPRFRLCPLEVGEGLREENNGWHEPLSPLQNALDYWHKVNGMFRFVVALFVKFHSLFDLVWCFNILNSLVLLGGLKQYLFSPQHLLYYIT